MNPLKAEKQRTRTEDTTGRVLLTWGTPLPHLAAEEPCVRASRDEIRAVHTTIIFDVNNRFFFGQARSRNEGTGSLCASDSLRSKAIVL
jgi:hypothetical protein